MKPGLLGHANAHRERRGAGWLVGITDIDWSNRLGGYAGVHLLLAVTPTGTITDFGFGAASTKDQPLADTFFAVRRHAGRILCDDGSGGHGSLELLGTLQTNSGTHGVDDCRTQLNWCGCTSYLVEKWLFETIF